MNNEKTISQRKKKGVIREWVESILIAAALAIFVRTFFFQVYKIPTGSMIPTLMPGDRIFVSRLVYGPKIPFTDIRLRFPWCREPRRGEVIVFIPPHDRKRPYIKRLVGLGGEHLEIKNGNVYINGKIVMDPRIAKNDYISTGMCSDGKEVVIPEGEYFFLGDNSANSYDSRFWGFVQEKDIIGKAIFIWWPPRRIGIIE